MNEWCTIRMGDHTVSSSVWNSFTRGSFLKNSEVQVNLHWSNTFCTVSHLNCAAVCQSESSNFFMYIINNGNRTELSPIRSVIIRVINKIGQS